MGKSISTTSNTRTTSQPTNAQAAIDAQFIIDAQSFSITYPNLANIDNLAKPLQFLAKAHYYLFTIYDELEKVGNNQKLNREKISDITAYIWAELEQVTFAFAGYDDDIKNLAEPLTEMAENLLTDFYADDEIISHISFIDFLIQVLGIHSRLDLVCKALLSTKVEGK